MLVLTPSFIFKKKNNLTTNYSRIILFARQKYNWKITNAAIFFRTNWESLLKIFVQTVNTVKSSIIYH